VKGGRKEEYGRGKRALLFLFSGKRGGVGRKEGSEGRE
jgi:hypothetical protein